LFAGSFYCAAVRSWSLALHPKRTAHQGGSGGCLQEGTSKPPVGAGAWGREAGNLGEKGPANCRKPGVACLTMECAAVISRGAAPVVSQALMSGTEPGAGALPAGSARPRLLAEGEIYW